MKENSFLTPDEIYYNRRFKKNYDYYAGAYNPHLQRPPRVGALEQQLGQGFIRLQVRLELGINAGFVLERARGFLAGFASRWAGGKQEKLV